MTTTYTTSDKVAGLLGITAFDTSSRPTKAFVESLINSYEEQIDTWTNQAWRGAFGKSSKLEYYDIRRDFYTNDGFQIIYLNHRNVRTLNNGVYSVSVTNQGTGYTTATVQVVGDGTGATATATITDGKITAIVITAEGTGYTTASITITGDGASASATATVYGDKLEIFDGNSWIDYLTTKTEGRNKDYFLNETEGILMIKHYSIPGKDYIRTQYRYGEEVVNGSIELACTQLVASDVIMQDDRATVALPDGNLTRGSDLNSISSKYKSQAMKIIDSNIDVKILF